MYGADAFGGDVPYAATSVTVADIPDFEAMLSGSDELVYTVDLTVWNIATDTASKLYLGSSEWATAPTDIPASTPFDGRLTTALQFSRSVVGDRIGINHTSGEATIAFANPDGVYDDYVDDYAIDGREVIVRIGRKTDAYVDHMIIFRGVGVDWSADQDTVTITVRDKSFLLTDPVQPNVYLGTGGAEGGDDLTGKRKPLSFGQVYGVPPVPVNPSLLIYQIHDHDPADGLEAVTATVYDRGTQLTAHTPVATYADLVAATMIAGNFMSSDDGYCRLGSTPAGVIFAIVQSYPGGSVEPRTSQVVDVILTRSGVLSGDEIDYGSLHEIALGTSPIAMHISAGDAMSLANVLSNLMAGIGGWHGFDRQGKLAFRTFTAPAGDPVAYFDRDQGDIIGLGREKLPAGIWPPPWRWRVAWKRNYTVFEDFAASVTDAVKIFYREPYRLADAEDAGVLVDHLEALDAPPVEAFFRSDTNAATEAARLLALYSAGYRLYRMTLTRRGLLLELGDVIHVTFPRFGLSGGKLMRVAAIEDRIQIGDGSEVDQVEIVAFG